MPLKLTISFFIALALRFKNNKIPREVGFSEYKNIDPKPIMH